MISIKKWGERRENVTYLIRSCPFFTLNVEAVPPRLTLQLRQASTHQLHSNATDAKLVGAGLEFWIEA